MSAEIVPLPTRATAEPDYGPRLQASLRVLRLARPADLSKPPTKAQCTARRKEQYRILIDLADALGVNLRAAAAMQEQSRWGQKP